jgi:N-sulfoglucosamine sulfohydrolase
MPISHPAGRIAALALLAAAGLAVALACAAPATAAPPSVLLITADDLGLQLSGYGDTIVSTPNIDQIGTEGVRFANAYVTQSSCSSSRSSIFTGSYPHQNGQIGLAHLGFSMDAAYPTLSSILRASGYRTGVIGKVHVNPSTAFAWDYNPPYPTWPNETRDVHRVAAAARSFLDATPATRPFFLKVSFLDPHDPWIDQVLGQPPVPILPGQITVNTWTGAPVREADKPAYAAYYNAVRRVDIGVGLLRSLLAEKNRLDTTLIVFLGDNGGGPVQGGKMDVFENGLRVPLLIRHPGVGRPGQVRTELVSTVDLLPTILGAAGVPVPDGTRAMMTEGRSLLPIIRGETVPWRRYLFAEMNYHTPELYLPCRTVRDARYKLMHCYPPVVRGVGGFMLFDLRLDRLERTNRIADPALAAVRDRLMRALSAWQTRTADTLPH